MFFSGKIFSRIIRRILPPSSLENGRRLNTPRARLRYANSISEEEIMIEIKKKAKLKKGPESRIIISLQYGRYIDFFGIIG